MLERNYPTILGALCNERDRAVGDGYDRRSDLYSKIRSDMASESIASVKQVLSRKDEVIAHAIVSTGVTCAAWSTARRPSAAQEQEGQRAQDLEWSTY